MNVSDLRLPLPPFQPVMFALGQTPGAGGREGVLRYITPELLPLLGELGFEADLFLIHQAAWLPVTLDLCSVYGEGVLVSGAEGQVSGECSRHMWARVTFHSSTIQSSTVQSSTVSATYFARGHERGVQAEYRAADAAQFHARCVELAEQRKFIRSGAEAMSYAHTTGALDLWRAAREELDFPKGNPPWNLELVDGRLLMVDRSDAIVHQPSTLNHQPWVSVKLTGFDAHGRLPPALVAQLPSLHGLSPAEIMLNKTRRELLRQALQTPALRIEPGLREILRQALAACESHALKAGIKKHHWRRYRDLRKVDAGKARYHLRLAQSMEAA